jgi:aspartate/methionine/tyrosine aminotransferase
MSDRKESIYMHWAKTARAAKYNLATSGVLPFPLKDLGITVDDMEINGSTIYGYEPLQTLLAAKIGVSPDCVAQSIGTSMANHLAMAGILEAGDEVLVEQPTYEPLLAVAKYLRANVKRFRREFDEEFRIEPEKIREQLTNKTKLIVLTNLHNPSGVFTPREVLLEVGKIARNAGARVLVDEVYLECSFPSFGSKISAFHLGNEFITTSSLTKAYGLSGLRCGWILAEPDLIRKFHRLNDLFSATPPHPAELLSVIALKQHPKIASRAKQLLDTNFAQMLKILDSVNYFLDVVRPPYGTIVFPRIKSGSTDEFLRVLREDYKTSVVPGSFFEMPDHFRLGIGCSTEDLRQGLENLQSVARILTQSR